MLEHATATLAQLHLKFVRAENLENTLHQELRPTLEQVLHSNVLGQLGIKLFPDGLHIHVPSQPLGLKLLLRRALCRILQLVSCEMCALVQCELKQLLE